MIKTIRMIIGTRRGVILNKATAFACLELLLAQAPYVLLYFILTALFQQGANPLTTNQLVQGSGSIQALPWIVIILCCFAAQTLFSISSLKDTHTGGVTVMRDVRLRLGEHLRKLPMGYFHRKNQGEISQALLSSIDELELVLTHVFNQIAASLVLAVITSLFMLLIDWRLAVAVLVSVPLAVPLLYWSQRVMDRVSKKRHLAAATVNGRLLEYMQNIRLLKAHNLTGSRFGHLAQALSRFRDDSIRMEATFSPVLGLFGAVLETGFVFLLFIGNMLLAGGDLEASVYLIFLIVSLRFYQPLRAIGTSLGMLKYLVNAGEVIRECLQEPELPEPKQPQLPLQYDVEFENVHFRYAKTPVLTDVSFHVPQQGMVAIVGPSGAGKSTIAQLIARFWDVNQGVVRIGGIDVRQMSNDQLMACVSMVFQDVYLFNDTILANIQIGNPKASFEQVMEAAKAANCHAFIEKLPEGYHTMVGEGGATLSGGEKQRVSIARAILKNAPIVLLDEATSSLDPENEWHVQRAIEHLASQKTVIVIAHRLKTIRSADKIIVLKQGTVAEQGNHEELLANNGLYSELWHEQQRAGGWKLQQREKQERDVHAL